MKAIRSKLATYILRQGPVPHEGRWVDLPGGKKLFVVPKQVPKPDTSKHTSDVSKFIGFVLAGLLFMVFVWAVVPYLPSWAL